MRGEQWSGGFPLLSSLLDPRDAPAFTLQPTPDPIVRGRPPVDGMDAERAEFRRTHHSCPEDDAELDALALRLYLDGRAPGLDTGLRGGVPGPHVAFARCAAAGLARLAPHRGPAVARCTPSAAEWGFCRLGTELTEWGFLTLGADSHPMSGLAVWSMSGRRIGDEVVFAPGTSFRVVGLRERGLLLLRELAASEVGGAPAHAELDDLTRRALLRFADAPSRTDQWPPPSHVPGFAVTEPGAHR
ncbi:hypothetical protein [Lentzea cavernae]|uniref:Uncharacterized protein n=1 Tax=Lentzea cavernae TaxID=2020703 RepID=A0ABQ3MSB2_9PSEU|nr:hypothetical protein [Lentzea cavernae]GHH56470.1 hypothetical protein GCM10017774_74580 [Lentzea cavernae]